MVGVGARAWKSRAALLLVSCLCVAVSMGAMGSGAVLQYLEIGVESLHEDLPANTAVTGDSVRIAAVLAPTDETEDASEVDVTFYFENQSTKETGLIGTTTMPGFYAAAGTVRRAVLDWSLENVRPGVYNLFAVGDFEVVLTGGEDPASAEDNPALEVLTILKDGLYLGFELSRDELLIDTSGYAVVGACSMGEDVAVIHEDYADDRFYQNAKIQSVRCVNLGTEDIKESSFEPGSDGNRQLRCWFRRLETGASDDYAPLENAFTVVSVAPSTVAKGEAFQLNLYVRYPFEFAPSATALGESQTVELIIQAYDSTGARPISDSVHIPQPQASVEFFSWADLWTYPEREECCEDSEGCLIEDGGTVELQPVVVETDRSGSDDEPWLVVYHTVTRSGASYLYANETGPSDLRSGVAKSYVETTRARWESPWQPEPAATIASFTAIPDGDLVRIFVATSDGQAYGIADTVNDKGVSAGQDNVGLWGPIAIPDGGDVLGCFVVRSGQQDDVIVFATSAGLYGYGIRNGGLLWEVADSEAILAAAGAGSSVWYATADDVFHFDVPSTGSSPAPARVIPLRNPLTSPIVAKEFSDGVAAVFAEEDNVFFHDPDSLTGLESFEVCTTRCRVTAVSLYGDTVQLAGAYAASVATGPQAFWIQPPQQGTGGARTLVTQGECQGSIATVFEGTPVGIAVLPRRGFDEPLAVFLTTELGELRSFSKDLCGPVKAVFWPPFDTDGTPKTDELAGKYDLYQADLGAAATAPVIGSLSVTDPAGDESLLEMILVGAEDGLLYAFDLTQAGREDWYWDWGTD